LAWLPLPRFAGVTCARCWRPALYLRNCQLVPLQPDLPLHTLDTHLAPKIDLLARR
jgi:hypothetical protein